MGVTFVTAFFLPSGPTYKTVSRYFELFESLASTGIPLIVYMDARLEEKGVELCAKHPNIQSCTYTTLDTSWIPKDALLPMVRNMDKDTPDYLCIQLTKLKLMAEVASMASVTTPYIAWIDFGIYHMMRDHDVCNNLLQRIAVSNFPTDRILSPGCNSNAYYDLFEEICWWHCGSFLLGEKSRFPPAYARQTALVRENLPRLTWEVNYWVMMNDVFTIYSANHDDLILQNLCDYICP
jgi:hypothetical protein